MLFWSRVSDTLKERDPGPARPQAEEGQDAGRGAAERLARIAHVPQSVRDGGQTSRDVERAVVAGHGSVRVVREVEPQLARWLVRPHFRHRRADEVCLPRPARLREVAGVELRKDARQRAPAG